MTEAAGAGTLRIVEALSGGLARAGHDVTLAHGRRPETPDDLGNGAGAAFALAPLDWDRRSVPAQARALRQLRGVVARVRPDVVHLHSAFAGLVGGALDGSAPRVYTPHGWASTHRDWRYQHLLGAPLDRFAIRRCDLLGVVSESEAEIGRKLGARRLAVVPNGIPELDGDGPGPAPDRPTTLVVAAGRIVASRRPAESAGILRAVRDVAETRWIGGGPDRAVAEVESLGVAITGWLPHGDAVAQLATATAYLHWSDHDGQSVAILEAIARDVVVVASDIPANRELLPDEQLFTRTDDAVRMLRQVVADPALRVRLLTAQRARGMDHGADRMVQGWTDAYRQAIGRGTGT